MTSGYTDLDYIVGLTLSHRHLGEDHSRVKKANRGDSCEERTGLGQALSLDKLVNYWFAAVSVEAKLRSIGPTAEEEKLLETTRKTMNGLMPYICINLDHTDAV